MMIPKERLLLDMVSNIHKEIKKRRSEGMKDFQIDVDDLPPQMDIMAADYIQEIEKIVILMDEIGYLEKAVGQAKKLARLPEDAKVVVYRRTEYPDDNLYNTATRYDEGHGSLISLELPGSLNEITTGFYYLWPAAMGE